MLDLLLVAVPCSPIPTTPATGGSCYRNVSAGDYCPDGFHRVEIESSKEQDRIIRDQKLQREYFSLWLALARRRADKAFVVSTLAQWKLLIKKYRNVYNVLYV